MCPNLRFAFVLFFPVFSIPTRDREEVEDDDCSIGEKSGEIWASNPLKSGPRSIGVKCGVICSEDFASPAKKKTKKRVTFASNVIASNEG